MDENNPVLSCNPEKRLKKDSQQKTVSSQFKQQGADDENQAQTW